VLAGRLAGPGERGAAAVEFVAVFLTLVVPVLYAIAVMADVQRALLAVSTAAREVGRTYVTASGSADALERAGVAYEDVMRNFGYATADPRAGIVLRVGCPAGSTERCSGEFGPGVEVTVAVTYRVPVARVPFVGAIAGPSLQVGATHHTRVDRYRSLGPVTAGGGAGAGRVVGWERGRQESGQMTFLLIGLVMLILMVLGLGWDASNWFLGHRALNNLADGAAIAAASEVDLRIFYSSGGRRVELADGQAATTVRRYLDDVAGDSGIEGVSLAAVRVERPSAPRGGSSVPGGARVTVELRAVAPVAFLRYLHVAAPEIEGRATATAEVLG
jgi:Flp pilus assembly protein TadG